MSINWIFFISENVSLLRFLFALNTYAAEGYSALYVIFKKNRKFRAFKSYVHGSTKWQSQILLSSPGPLLSKQFWVVEKCAMHSCRCAQDIDLLDPLDG